MDLIREFRNPNHVLAIAKNIEKTATKKVRIMEVCGGHTHTIMKHGLNQLVSNQIEFIHGPGCPVCVMPKERIDHAIELASQKDVILATLGDMIRVPGSKTSLQKLRSKGADIRALYTPLDVLKIAKENPSKKVVFFAIGFETTTPMTALVVQKTIEQNIKNLFFHINHVLVPEVIEALMEDENVKIDAFLGPSHVSVITGYDIFKPLAKKFKTPIVVGGFEPSDVLEALLMIIMQINKNQHEAQNQYTRAVTCKGNIKAQELINTFFEKRESFRWRGIGDVPKSALKLKDEYSFLDAEAEFELSSEKQDDHKLCICGDILRGLAKPKECRVFGKGCTPSNPMGSCMVSSEGACAAYFKYSLSELEEIS